MDLWDIIGPILLTIIVVGGVWGYASKTIPDLFGYINILVLYIPISLLFAGFIPDIVSQKFKYSVIGISGLCSVILNRLASSLAMYFLGKPSNLTAALSKFPTDPTKLMSYNTLIQQYRHAYSGCSVPGFEFFESTLVPQSLVLLSSMYAFTMLDILVNDASKNVTGLSVSFLILIAIQTYFNVTNGCFNSGLFIFGENPYIRLAAMFGCLFAFAMAGAGIGYGIKMSIPADNGKNIGGNSIFKGGLKSSDLIATKDVGISDQDQFVCDAYKNGELITSTIVE
jgi:hypothetical protein